MTKLGARKTTRYMTQCLLLPGCYRKRLPAAIPCELTQGSFVSGAIDISRTCVLALIDARLRLRLSWISRSVIAPPHTQVLRIYFRQCRILSMSTAIPDHILNSADPISRSSTKLISTRVHRVKLPSPERVNDKTSFKFTLLNIRSVKPMSFKFASN